jgi:hypothetical protein
MIKGTSLLAAMGMFAAAPGISSAAGSSGGQAASIAQWVIAQNESPSRTTLLEKLTTPEVIAARTDAGMASPSKAPSFSCYRHIYNPTSCPWTFASNPSVNGNVWFLGQSCTRKALKRTPRGNCTNPNGNCTIDPYCTMSIQYTYTEGVTQGTWVITDQTGASNSWSFEGQTPGDACPYIDHSGGTGAVSLNEPANGDMTVGACTWNGASVSAKEKRKSH